MSERTRRASKPWGSCQSHELQSHGQQQLNRKKQLSHNTKGALNFCETDGFKPRFVEVKNLFTRKLESLDYDTGVFSSKEDIPSTINTTHSTLYIKDKYSVLDTAFHELSMMSNLPNTYQTGTRNELRI